ncbi:MAG TPA: hypothetical protein VHY22_13005 [Chthoniobacteraceae bacterium]|jgi:hypothetical protein|nr:hypothetical protein [Chthoniobacteraceae bacterium]
MRNPFTMINLAGQPLESFPAWGFGVISDNSITWGVDGVIAAWIYFLNLSLEFGKKRWLMCDSTYRTARWAEARNRTAFWLKQHDYPKELYEVYEMRSSA